MKKKFLFIVFCSFFLIPFNSVFAGTLSDGTTVNYSTFHLWVNERHQDTLKGYDYCVYNLLTPTKSIVLCSDNVGFVNSSVNVPFLVYFKKGTSYINCWGTGTEEYYDNIGCNGAPFSFKTDYASLSSFNFSHSDYDLYSYYNNTTLVFSKNISYEDAPIVYYNLSFTSDFEDYTVVVYDSDNNEIESEENGTYKLVYNTDYTYTATKKGYKDISNTINLSSDKTINLNFEISKSHSSH